MKKITMFILKSCPYCIEALRHMDRLAADDSRYGALDIEIIDEQERSDIADTYDYYYVPAYYVDGEKLHEGAASLQSVRRVFDAALRER